METSLWAAIERLAHAGAAFRLCDVRRGRLHAGANPRHGGAHPIRDRCADGSPPDLHRRYSCRDRRDRRVVLGCRHPPCRRAPWRRARDAAIWPLRTGQIPPATPTQSIWWQVSSAWRTSRSASPPTRRRIPTLRAGASTSTTSSARSTPARRGPSRSSSSTTTSTCASSSEPGRPASRFRSSPGSCPSRTSQNGRLCSTVRRDHPSATRGSVRRPRRRSGDSSVGRRVRRGRAMRLAPAPRRRRVPLLHAQPGRARRRHLPPARCPTSDSGRCRVAAVSTFVREDQ